MYLSAMNTQAVNLITGYDITRDECGERHERTYTSVDTTPVKTFLATCNRNIYYDVRNNKL